MPVQLRASAPFAVYNLRSGRKQADAFGFIYLDKYGDDFVDLTEQGCIVPANETPLVMNLAQRCGGNGERGTPGAGTPYLNNHSFHKLPYGGKRLQVIYMGMATISSEVEAAVLPNIFTATDVTFSGGTGYVDGEIVTMALTTSTGIIAAKAQVAKQSGGVPTVVNIIDGGAYNTPLGAGATQASTTGSGTGLALTFTWQGYAAGGLVGIEPVFNNQVFTGIDSVKALYKGLKGDGQRDRKALVPTGDFFISEPIECDVAIGGVIGIRALWAYSGVPCGRVPMVVAYGYPSNLEEAFKNATAFDESLSGTISGGASSVLYQPVAVIGEPKVYGDNWMIWGHSRETGQASGTGAISSLYDVMDLDGNIGWLEKALGNVGGLGVPYSNFARGSDKYRSMIPATNPAITGRAGRMKAAAFIRPTVVYLPDPVNDFTVGDSVATVVGKQKQLIQELKAMGVRKFVTSTCDPVTTSSDGWATVGNQTSSTGSANRIAYNDQLLSGAGAPFDIVINNRSIVESSVGSDKWVVTGAANYATGDGTHCSPAIHELKRANAVVTLRAAGF